MAQMKAQRPRPQRMVRVYSYSVQCRISQVGTADKDIRSVGVVDTSREAALRHAEREIGVPPSEHAQYLVSSAAELNPDEAKLWLAWHEQTAAAEAESVGDDQVVTNTNGHLSGIPMGA